MITLLPKEKLNPGFAPGFLRLAYLASLICFITLLAAPGKLLAQSITTHLPSQIVVCTGASQITLTASAEHQKQEMVVQWQTLSNGTWVNVNTTPTISHKGAKPVITTSTLTLSNYADKQTYRVAFGVSSVDPATSSLVTSTTIIIPSAGFTVPTELFAGTNINLTFTGSASKDAKYQWATSDGTDAPAIANPAINFSAPGEKTITLTVTDGNCSATTYKKIRVHGNYTWNGSKNVDWYDAANWTPNLVPGTNDDVTINTAPFPPVLSANTSIKNLTLNTETIELDSATLIVSGNASLNGGAINGGTIAFGGNILVEGNTPVNISNAALTGSASQVISKSGNVAPVFNNLAINKTENKVTLETNLTINGTLDLNNANNLVLGNSDLLIAPTGKIIAGQAGYVVTSGLGTLQMTVANDEAEVFFPVGNHSYNPVKIKQKVTGVTDIFKVRVQGGLFDLYDEQNNGLGVAAVDGVSRTWIIEEAVKGSSHARITLQFSADNTPKDWSPEFDPNKAVMAKFNGSSWESLTTGSANLAQDNSKLLEVSLENLNSFRIFGVFNYNHQSLTTLPVELVSFKATRVKDDVELKWQTALEKNNNYFTLELSTNGKTFKELTKVKGVGNSNQLHNYSYLHKNAPSQVIYYRLKQTDFDGTSTYSKVVSVNGNAPVGNLVVYPNPGNGLFTLQGATNVTDAIVLDATGRIIKKLNVLDKTFSFDLSDQQSGIYFLRLTNPTGTQTLRLVKK